MSKTNTAAAVTSFSHRSAPEPVELLPGLWWFRDTCNVYVICDGATAVAVDFGSGRWLQALPRLGITRLEHIFLTHCHADQCGGLPHLRPPRTVIHASAGDDRWLAPAAVRKRLRQPRYESGCPENYAPPAIGVPGVRYDLAGFTDLFWRRRRIRFLHTPGHTSTAQSVVLDHAGRQVVFCGDAAHAGGTVWEPYHLEWDHWTAGGALAAWQGVERLRGIAVDLLCPAHGPVVRERSRLLLASLSRRLLRLVEAKGQVAAGEPDRYLEPEVVRPAWRRILPGLFQFGANGYLLASQTGEALVVDPFTNDLPALEKLLAGEARGLRPSACVASHYHFDHCDAMPELRRRFGARLWLHPRLAEILDAPQAWDAPWLPRVPLRADGLWPAHGHWQWHEFNFRVAPWPGQTWWHCAFQTTVAQRRVLFAGDSFQPPSRWNGTGGFCAYNRSRFREGFESSARVALDWAPDLLAAGHGTCYHFAPSYFRAVIRWSRRAESAVRDLCPTGDLAHDYYAAFPTKALASVST